MGTATSPERDRVATLEELTADLAAWQKALVNALGDQANALTDRAQRQRIYDTAERMVRLDGELHGADFDPEWVAEFRGLLLDSLRAIQAEEPLDAFDKLLLNVEAMRHLLRDALDGHVDGSEEDVSHVVEELQRWLPSSNQAELASLMGVSKRQYQRWALSHARPSRRAQIVSHLVAVLRRSWTDAGVVAWFYRDRPGLDGMSPIDVIDRPDYEQRLLREVRQGRAQHGV